MLVSDAAPEVDVSDVVPPELVLSLEPVLVLDEDDDDAGSSADVGPTPKLDSPEALGLQASADTGATIVAAARRVRADMTA